MNDSSFKIPDLKVSKGSVETTNEPNNPNKKFVDPQTQSMASNFLQNAKRSILNGDTNRANDYLSDFANISGHNVSKVTEGFLRGKKTAKNTKYINSIANDYNIDTIKKFITEAEKRGLNNQASLYSNLLQKVQNASITPEASVEASAFLDKKLSQMRYFDSPVGIRNEDLLELDNIERRYRKEKEKSDEVTIDNFRYYGNVVKDGLTGAGTGLTFLVDLSADAYGFIADKPNTIQATQHLIQATGADPNSFAYKIGNIASIFYAPPFLEGLQVLKSTGSIFKAWNTFKKVSQIGSVISKMQGAVLTYLAGNYTSSLTSTLLDEIDISENKKPLIVDIAGLLAGHKVGEMYGAYSEPTETQHVVNKPSKGNGDGGIYPEYNPKGGGDGNGSGTDGRGNGGAGQNVFGTARNKIVNGISESINKGNEIASNILRTMGENISKTAEFFEKSNTENIPSGRKFKDSYIETTNQGNEIKNVSIKNINEGAENVANYNRKILPEGSIEVLERSPQDIANVIREQADYIETLPATVEEHFVTSVEGDKLIIQDADSSVTNFVDAVLQDLPITELDGRLNERGSLNLITRMMKSEFPEVQLLGESLHDIIRIGQLQTDTLGREISNMISKSKLDTKNAIFDIIGINEDQVNLYDLDNKSYTGNISRKAINELKKMIDNNFRPEFETMDISVNNSVNNPALDVEGDLEILRDTLNQLADTQDGVPVFDKQLEIIANDIGSPKEHILKYLTDLLHSDVSDMKIPTAYKRSLAERLRRVRGALRTASTKDSRNTVQRNKNQIGGQGLFNEAIYEKFSSKYDEIFKDALHAEGEDVGIYDYVNNRYREFAELRTELGKALIDPQKSGSSIFSELVSDPSKINRLLAFAEGQDIPVNSNISKLIQLVKATKFKPILNVTPEGEIIFNIDNQKGYTFGKRGSLRSLFNENQMRLIDEAVKDASIIGDLDRFRKNNSNSTNLRYIMEEQAGKSLVNQIDNFLSADSTTTGLRIAKNIGKLGKIVKVKSLNRVVLFANALLKGITNITDAVQRAQYAKSMASILQAVLNPHIQSAILNNSASLIETAGYKK